MEKIMTMVLDESEEISLDLLGPLLASIRKEDHNVLAMSWKLGEKLITNCAFKLTLYLQECVASDTFCLAQAVDTTFKLVEELDLLLIFKKKNSTILDTDKEVSFATSIPHIEFVILDKYNYVMQSKVSLFFILPTVVPDLKQASNARIFILRHFKTRGQVFSNKESIMQGAQPNLQNLLFQIFFLFKISHFEI